MTIEKYSRPVLFYGLSTAIPWAFWFAAAYLSHITPTNRYLAAAVGVLGVVGLLAPTLVAFRMIWPHADLRADLKRRLVGIKGVRPLYLVLTCFLMLASILLAQTISLLFGYSADQFSLAAKSSFSAGIFPGWFLLFLALSGEPAYRRVPSHSRLQILVEPDARPGHNRSRTRRIDSASKVGQSPLGRMGLAACDPVLTTHIGRPARVRRPSRDGHRETDKDASAAHLTPAILTVLRMAPAHATRTAGDLSSSYEFASHRFGGEMPPSYSIPW